jgi:7-cyano-7-deazaguanine synthase
MPKTSALVLSSGGLHSLVAAGIASREYRIAMLHVKDGRATALKALEAFDKQVAHFKPVKHWIVDSTYMRQMALPPEVAGSVQTTSSDPQGNLIPLRELQLLTIAAGFARQLRADTVIWGVHLDASTPEAVARNIEVVQVLNQLLELVSPDSPVTIKTPLVGLEDQQVIELGYQMAIPLAASWTCQMDIPNPCMSCPACAWRTRAFRAAQLADPLVTKK